MSHLSWFATKLKTVIGKEVNVSRFMKSTPSALAFSTKMQEFTPEEIREKFMSMFGFGLGHAPGHGVRAPTPKSQDELPERCMQDSFSTVVLPLAKNRYMRNMCATSSGSVRPGRLMEYMDLVAVWTAVQYVSLPTMKPGDLHPYTFPTVQVDRVDFTDYTPKSDVDVRYCGKVSWAGRSSCEILMWLEQDTGASTCQRIAEAVFVMVVRNITTFAPGFINKLVPKDELEHKLLVEAEGRKERRALLANASLIRTAPDSKEQSLLHQLFLGSLQRGSPLLTSTLPPGSVWLGDTTHVSPVVSFREDENLHGTVFGGFVMRRALEVSETCAQLFSKQQPRLRHVSNIQFFKGIEIGDLLSMHSQVVFTQQGYIQITTHAEVLDASTGQSAVVALFHYTFQVPDAVATILPRTYAESMKYLDGRRHFMYVLNLESKL